MTARTNRHLSEWPSWKVVYFKTSFRRESRLGETAEARLRSRWVERECIEEQELAVGLSSEIWQNDLHHQRMVVKPGLRKSFSFAFSLTLSFPPPSSPSRFRVLPHLLVVFSLSLPNDLFPMLSLKKHTCILRSVVCHLETIIIGSAEALPILCVRYFWWEREREIQRERERKRDRRKWRHHCRAKIGDELHFPLPKIRNTIVALKIGDELHFPLPKIRKVGDELTLSLAKNSHFSFLPSHFPSLPSRRGHHGGAKIRNEFTLSIAKNFFALGFIPPFFKWHEPRDEWSKTQDKWSNLAQSYFVLPIEKLNQINTKNYWK